MGYTAAEKYEAPLAARPIITQRVPQHIIAAYLGMTPAFLSRIRRRRATCIARCSGFGWSRRIA